MPPQAPRLRLTAAEEEDLRRRDAQTEAVLERLSPSVRAPAAEAAPTAFEMLKGPEALRGGAALLGALDRPPTRGYNTDLPYTTPLRLAMWPGSVGPELAGTLASTLRGTPRSETTADPMAPLEEQTMWGSELAYQGVPAKWATRIGTAADLLLDPLDVATGGGAALATLPLGVRAIRRLRPSRAQNEARGLYHPVGEGKKLPVPVTEMTSEYMPSGVAMADTRIINPASMEGAAIIPATGDRSRAGATLTAVGDTPLDQPVLLEGGPDFMRTHAREGSAWASTKNALTKLANRSKQASKASLDAGGSGDVYMVYMPQDHAAVDFSVMMSDALMAQIPASKVTRRLAATFDRMIKKTRPEWKGVFHPDAREQLAQSGELRHGFVNAMKLDEFSLKGFPDVTRTRVAIIEPLLMNVPQYHGGFSVAKLDPSGRMIDAPAVPHRTYNTQLAGEYAGKLPEPVPPDVMFPEFYRRRRAEGKPPSRDIRSFLLSNPFQIATPEWVRENAAFLARTGAVTALLTAGQTSTQGEE
jgi:hypothetical protein